MAKKAAPKKKVTKAQMRATLDNAFKMIEAVVAAASGIATAEQNGTVDRGGLAVTGGRKGCDCGK